MIIVSQSDGELQYRGGHFFHPLVEQGRDTWGAKGSLPGQAAYILLSASPCFHLKLNVACRNRSLESVRASSGRFLSFVGTIVLPPKPTGAGEDPSGRDPRQTNPIVLRVIRLCTAPAVLLHVCGDCIGREDGSLQQLCS